MEANVLRAQCAVMDYMVVSYLFIQIYTIPRQQRSIGVARLRPTLLALSGRQALENRGNNR
jgi:hypothetical protein